MANVLLLPAATKIKSRVEHYTELKELMLEGVVGIVEGLNPRLIRSKLDAYRHNVEASSKAAPAKEKEKKPASAAQPAQGS